MDVSVVIPAFNAADTLGEQLDALAGQSFEGRWEVVVADNGSKDTTKALVAERARSFPVPLRLVEASGKPGAAFARNSGAAQAEGSILAFCDADDWVQPGWLVAANNALAVGDIAVGCVRFADGHAMNPEVQTGNTPRHVLSGNFAISREAFNSVGGFDDNLPRYAAEDMDFSQSVRESGLTLVAAPEMVVRFRESSSIFALVRKIYLNAIGETLIWQKRRGVLPPLSATIKSWLSLPLWGAGQLLHRPRKEQVKQVIREAVRRTGHLVGHSHLVRQKRTPR